jgi:hypothetical protein
VSVGLGRLLKRFYLFLGLGVFMNPWTGIFLAMVAVSAAGSVWQVMQVSGAISRWQPLLAIAGGLVGNLSSVVGRVRLPGKPQLVDASSQGKDLDKLLSDNVLIMFIAMRIRSGMNREINRMSKQYDWVLIKTASSRLLQNQRALEPSKEKAAEEAEKYVLAFEPSNDVRTDVDNKYRALQRVVGVSSFLELRSRLKESAAEAA